MVAGCEGCVGIDGFNGFSYSSTGCRGGNAVSAFGLGAFEAGLGIGNGDCYHFSYLDDDVFFGFVVGVQLMFHVALIVVAGVANIDDFSDYYDDCVLSRC